MENIATSVRVTAAAHALLSDLTARTGKSKAQVVEEALRAWEERNFWAAVQFSFASEPESDELRSERDLWEGTLTDGFEPRPHPKKASPRRRKAYGGKK